MNEPERRFIASKPIVRALLSVLCPAPGPIRARINNGEPAADTMIAMRQFPVLSRRVRLPETGVPKAATIFPTQSGTTTYSGFTALWA